MLGSRTPGRRNAAKLLGAIVVLSLIAVFIKAVLIDIVYVERQYAKNEIVTPWGEKLKSGSLSVDYSLEQVFSDIEKLGLNTVNVPVQIDIPTITSNTMNINAESKAKAVKLIKRLRLKGILVILEPYPYIKNGECYETELKPADVDIWFRNWKQEVLGPLIRDIAKPYDVYALCFASNFEQIESEYDEWRAVADFVRTIYAGKITYKTNWWYTANWEGQKIEAEVYNRKIDNPLWAKVDFISVAAYFELTDQDTNSVEDLVQAIHSTQVHKRRQNVFAELENMAARWNKPVFFGELGFPKRNRAAAEPWNPMPSEIVNEQEQANCFLAYREVFEKAAWHLGFSVFAIGQNDEQKNYYPSEQSFAVINSWYK